MNVELQGPDVSGFPFAFLTSFFANLNQRPSIDMKDARRSDRPLPGEDFSPYSIGRVDGGSRKFIVSATGCLGKYFQMTAGSVSQHTLKEEGRMKAHCDARDCEAMCTCPGVSSSWMVVALEVLEALEARYGACSRI